MKTVKFKRKFWSGLTIGLGFFLLGSELVCGQVEKGRTWTDVDGKKLFALLRGVEGEDVVFEIGGKEVRVNQNQLGKADQEYLKSFAKRQPFGKIEILELTGATEKEGWLTEHRMRSFVWKGKGLEVPFLLHVPELKVGDEAPLLIYLHGTGGLGTDNLKPLFNDAGGVAKSFMDESFQNYRASFVMIPQCSTIGGWDRGSLDVPTIAMRGLVDAIRLMDKDPEMSIDPSQIFLTGLSMGGAGVFDGLSKFPRLFAAGIAISAISSEEAFSREMGNLAPLWIAVNKGDRDYEERTREFRRHYIAEGGDIRISVFDQKGHNAWDALLKDQAFRQWLFRQEVK